MYQWRMCFWCVECFFVCIFFFFILSFFFFKQKTAYEMRISDWSSDVCSSDLMELAVVLIDGEFHGCPSVWPREIVDAIAEGVEEIGRASCRERVCQYV